MKKKRDEEENKKYLDKPKINKRSKKLASKNKEDFYTRQVKLMEEKKKKEKLFKEKLKKEEQKLLSHNLSRIDKNKKKCFEETINKLYEWEIKRKEKINQKAKDKEKEMKNKIQNIPIINNNKSSYKIKVKRNQNQIINRLYKDDICKREENKEVLNKIYSPKFQPLIIENQTLIKMNSNINKNNLRNKKISLKKNNNNFSCISLSHNNKLNNYNSFTINCKGNISDDYRDEFVNHLIRKHVFSKIKKKQPRYRTEMRFNIIDYDNNKNDIYSNDNYNNYNYYDDNHNKNYDYNINSGYVNRTIKKIKIDLK